MKIHQACFVFIVSFLFGIFVADLLREDAFVKLFFVSSVVFIGCFWWLRDGDLWRKFLLVVLGILVGVFRFFVAFDFGYEHISNFEGYYEISGCIESEVDVRNDKVKYVVDVYEIGGVDLETNAVVYGKVLVNAARYPVYKYGDCLKVTGVLEKPGKIESFSYDNYLARYRIFAVIYRGEIVQIPGKAGNDFFKWVFWLKGEFEGRLNEIFSEPHSSFMAGLILGSRKGIADHLMEDFNTTGLTHIIAISGYNITLVIVIVSGIFGFLGRKKKVIFSMFFIFCFTILVGASAAVVRAAIMGSISLVALWYGRQYMVGMALFLAAFFMNMWNPLILVYDVGFQLSFLATCGLIYVSPSLEKYFLWLPDFLGVRESVLMTLSAQILALPIIVLCFGRLSLICPVANLFVLPFIPLAMIFGFFAVCVSFVWGFFGQFVGFFGYLILEIVIFIVKFFASFKYSSISAEWGSWWMLLLYYLWLWKKAVRSRISIFS